MLVGHFNSGVALPAYEVYKDAMLAMISPAITQLRLPIVAMPMSIAFAARDDVHDGTEERANFALMIIPLKAKNPDLVYLGGIYPSRWLAAKTDAGKGSEGGVHGT